MSTLARTTDQAHVEECLQRIAGDLALVTDREFVVESVACRRSAQRAIGRGQIHISFRFGVEHAGGIRHGCLLVPLTDAISIAGCVMLQGDEEIQAKRGLQVLDAPLREALVEVAGFIARALAKGLESAGLEALRVEHESCQGVRAGVRPALDQAEGEELLVGLAGVRLHTWPGFEMILMLPALKSSAS